MDTLFREFADLMDDSNDKMPEGTYLEIYDKLLKLKNESNKNTPQIAIGSVTLAFHKKRERDLLNHCEYLLQRGDSAYMAANSHARAYEIVKRENKVLEDQINDLKKLVKAIDPAAVASAKASQMAEKETVVITFAMKVRRREDKDVHCRCGSRTHLNTNFLGCRLNKKVLAGRHGPDARDRALAETTALADPPTEV